MSALDEYIDGLVNDKEDEYDFPKNESSWEELFEFGKRSVYEIVSLRKELIRLQRIEKAVTKWKESVDWYPDRECFCIHCKLYFALEGSEE